MGLAASADKKASPLAPTAVETQKSGEIVAAAASPQVQTRVAEAVATHHAEMASCEAAVGTDTKSAAVECSAEGSDEAIACVEPKQPSKRQDSRASSGDEFLALPTSTDLVLTTPVLNSVACSGGQGDQHLEVRWTVDGRKLRSHDKQLVSPAFELALPHAHSVPFRIMLCPIAVSDARRGGSFKKAMGRGTVHVKCEGLIPADLELRVSIGQGPLSQPPRGPAVHNFAANAVCGLPRDIEEWDFASAVDQESKTLAIVLEIIEGVK